MNSTPKQVEILLVEDSSTDRLIAIEALSQSRVLNNLHTVDDGVDAMDFLRRRGKFANAPRPDLIILDLNLPRKDGREVLAEIKRDALLLMIPVVVLTTSQAEADIAKAYGSHANCYIAKPMDFQRFLEIVASIEHFWFEVVTLPPEPVLPRSTSPAGEKTTPLHKKNALELQPLRILLVEDNPTDVILINDALDQVASTKFQSIHVERASEAVAKLCQKDQFDVVLCDLGLPDSQGLETFIKLREYAGELPVVVLTSLDDEVMGTAALQIGAQDYLVKSQMSGAGLARSIRYAIERQRLESQLRQAQRMEAIGQLAGGVAHDFNNLLTVIQGHAALMQDAHSISPSMADSIQQISEAAQRAAGLTRQLLAFSRRQAMKPTDLDVNDIVGRMVKMLNRTLGEHIGLQLQLAAQLPPVHADAGMLEQVVLNLAINARDAMPAGGRLTIQTTFLEMNEASARQHPEARPGRFVRISVIDTGQGISPAHLPRIFEPFFTTKDVGRGTGLGLATVHGIVHQHRGWITVESTVGKGAAFQIYMPAMEAAPHSVPPTERLALGQPRGHGETILVAEDDELLRIMVTEFLNLQGYRTLVASNGTEALELFRQHHSEIDMVFTDMVMPEGVSGKELITKLQTQKPGLKYLLTSGYSLELLYANEWMDDKGIFLQKPYQLSKLLDAIEICLARQL